MSASFSRPSPVRQQFRASLKADPGEQSLCSALAEAESRLDNIQRVIGFRVDNDAPAANHQILDDIRRIGGELMAAADDYQNGRQ